MGGSGCSRTQPATPVTSASAAASPIDRRFQDDLAGAPATAACVVGKVNAGLLNASASSFAVPNRSAATFSNAFAVAAATWGGTDYRNSATGRASSATIFITIACADPPVWGGSPANISYNTHPNE